MADEEILNEEGTDEPNIEQEESDGFDSYVDGTADKDTGDKDGDGEDGKADEEDDKSGEEDQDKDGDDEGKDKEGGEDDGKKEDEEEDTAEKRAIKRAERFKDGDDKGGEDEDKGKKKSDTDDGDDKGKTSSVTKEQIKTYLDIIPDDDLPGEIIVGNETIDMKGLKENFPEDYGTIKVLAGMMATKVATQLIEDAGYVKAGEVSEQISSLKGELAYYGFWDTVRDAHTDGKTVAKSDEFKVWVKDKPASIKALYNSPDPEDAISLLDYYKEDLAKKKVKDHDDKQRDGKKKKDGLHSAGMRSKPSTKKSETQNDMEDEEAGFNEGLASVEQ